MRQARRPIKCIGNAGGRTTPARTGVLWIQNNERGEPTNCSAVERGLAKMNVNSKVSCAIAAILGASALGLSRTSLAADATAPTSEAIDEVTVTAQRRTENLQNVPITIQALTGDTLSKLHVANLDDFIKYLPNVTAQSNGPGQSNITMRGLSVGFGASSGSGSIGQIPNVAVYLDDVSAALPSRNLDIYAADLERIEVLEGPQGTLFGAGAQAGVVRYITNKPKLDVTEGNVNAGYGITAGGDPNANLDATFNWPVLPGTLAVRAVVYDDHRGGYINNLPSTFTRKGTDIGIADNNGGIVPTNSEIINNNNQTGNAINPVTYQGFRLSGLYKINDDWDVLLQQSYQDMDAEGVFYQMPIGSDGQTLPRQSVTLFNPSYNKDKFENTALTVTGKIGPLKAVYSGGYLVRNVEQQQDYTNYARGVFGYYYQCTGFTYSSVPGKGNPNGTCFTPSTTWKDKEKNTHQSHEFRLSTPDEWRLRAIGGLYYEEYKIYDDNDWQYKTVPTCSATYNNNCFNNVAPWPDGPQNNPNVRNDNTGFFDDFLRTYKQKAAFLSADFDLIPHALTVTAGTRYYKFNDSELGGDVGSFYCKHFTPTSYFGPCQSPYGTDLNKQVPNHLTASGFKSRGNVTWHVTSDAMLYYTFSQGFRPGGFNRGVSSHIPGPDGVNQYITPASYAPDVLTNNEIGWKTEWLDHRLQFNGAVYKEDWKDTQTQFYDPEQLGNLGFATNGPSYRVKGVEIQLVTRPIDGLTIQGAAAWNSSEQTNSPFLIDNNPASVNFGKPITSIANPYGLVGSALANSPPFEANLRARYDWAMWDYQAFVQFGGQHQAHSLSRAGNVDNTTSSLHTYDMPGFSTYDGALGVSKDAWTAQLYGQNLFNSNASQFTTYSQWVEARTVVRPRVLGLKFSYNFGGK
jgi:iron complex outermembrane receptor protein